jgi:hypothetical protein
MRDKPRLLRVGTNVGHWVKTDGTMLQGDPLQYGAVCFKGRRVFASKAILTMSIC